MGGGAIKKILVWIMKIWTNNENLYMYLLILYNDI